MTESPQNPIERLKEVLRDLRGGRDADEALVAICGSLVTGSKDAVATCGAQLSMFPKAHFIGHGKYHMMQERFLQVCEELGLPAKPERHPGTSTSYATVEHPRLRITIAKVRRYDLNPRLHPFRLVTNVKHFRPDQIPLLPALQVALGEQLVIVIVFGYSKSDRATPAFLEARFVGKDGITFSEYRLDLLQIRKDAKKPAIESLPEKRTPTIRIKKRRNA